MVQEFSQYPDMMIISEVAACLRVSTPVVEALIDNREIAYIAIGTTNLICKSDLITYLEKNRHMCYDGCEKSHLDNRIEAGTLSSSEGESDMANRINQAIEINGEKHWITARTAQEFANKIASLVTTEKLHAPQRTTNHPFDLYAWNWFHTYSLPTVATVTATTYKRQIENVLIPAFEGLAVEDITPDHVQQMFNRMSGVKATKEKAKIVLNQIFEAALEDKFITTNPLKSRKVKITGAASKTTAAYSVEQMQYLVAHIKNVKNECDQAFLALHALHPLRLEEGLGLKGEDIDRENMTITIRRAVTHPSRNQPEVKEVKTEGSGRTIALSTLAMSYIPKTLSGRYVFGGDSPLSYTVVRRMCQRIKKDTQFEENITPIRFRTTVLTDMYDQTKDIKLVQQAAGHTTSAMTLKHYVKGRQTAEQGATAVERLYTA